MAEILRHCQPKGTETDRLDLNYFAPLLYSVTIGGGDEQVDRNESEPICSLVTLIEKDEPVQEELRIKEYRPSPAKRVYISKPDGRLTEITKKLHFFEKFR